VLPLVLDDRPEFVQNDVVDVSSPALASESAISELQSRDELRLEGVISRLERRRAEVVAALASKGPPER